jgi:hypothetical protein
MLRLQTFVVAILLIGVVQARSSLPPAQEPPKETSKTQKESAKTEKNPPSFAGALLVETGILIHRNRDDISAISTAIIAIFTVVLGVFTIRLSSSTRIAAKAARDTVRKMDETAERQLRAYVMVGKAQAIWPDGTVVIDINIKNFGQTPALV